LTFCQWFDLKTTGTVCQWFDLKITGTVFFGLALKSVMTVSPDLASKPVAQISQFGPQNRQLQFGDLCLKITVMFSWFVHQTQVDNGLSIAPQNRREGDSVGHASRSSDLLHVEASRVRVSQFASKLAETR
jgi:hypothetical protein